MNIIGDEIHYSQAGRDRSMMADFEGSLRTFLAHYDELERNQETEDGFIKEFMVRFTWDTWAWQIDELQN